MVQPPSTLGLGLTASNRVTGAHFGTGPLLAAPAMAPTPVFSGAASASPAALLASDKEARDNMLLREYFDLAASYQSKLMDRATNYNQIVVLAGYAGFFAVWSAMVHDLPTWIVMTSGALVVISLAVYVSWTVLGMVMSRADMGRMIAEISKGPDGFFERAIAAEKEALSRSDHYMKFWKRVLWASGVPALVAALLLSGASIWKVAFG